MSKHTPGPWTKDVSRIFGMTKYGERSVAQIHALRDYSGREPDLFDETDANMRLIAAAPEILEALKQGVEQLEADYQETPLDGHGALIRKFRTVIAKAEGK
jgi:hypothetical protein